MASVEIKAGSFVWAYAFRHNTSKESMALKQEPVYGMLAADSAKSPHEALMARLPCPRAAFFIPCKQNSVTELAWSRAVRVESREYASTREEAVRMYNCRIKAAIGWHRKAMSELESALLPESDGA